MMFLYNSFWPCAQVIPHAEIALDAADLTVGRVHRCEAEKVVTEAGR